MTTKKTPSPPEDWHYIVQDLEKIAVKKNLSTYDLAELSGIRQPNISRIFSLRYSPTLKILLKIANAVGSEIIIRQKADPFKKKLQT